MINSATFLGSKKFGLEIFKAVYRADPDVTWTILCPPDESDVRTHHDEFLRFAAEEDVAIHVVSSPQKVLDFVRLNRPDVMIVCGYYRILPPELLHEVREGVWGIHNSLLPKYRGGSPLVWQIINGEQTVGSSFFKFGDGMDDGPVLEQVSVSGADSLSIKEAMDLLEGEWISRLPEIWRKFRAGAIVAREQDHAQATYCAMRQDTDGKLDWQQDATTLDRFIRAQASPYPRAFFDLAGTKVRVVSHELDRRKVFGSVGQLFELGENYAVICCGGNSVLRITEVEVDGQIVPAREILNSVKLRL